MGIAGKTPSIQIAADDGGAAGYLVAVHELLRRVSELWEAGASDLAEGTLSPFESFLGVSLSSSALEPIIITAADIHDTNDNLVRWLKEIPRRVLDQAAVAMGCYQIDFADTREEAVKVFLRHFGYIDKADRTAPEGILTAREIAEEASRRLSQCDGNDVGCLTGHATTIAQAIESSLQLLVLFYGQFIMPGAFAAYLRQRRRLDQDAQERENWWKSVKAEITQGLRSDIHDFLLTHKTQMEMSIRILETLDTEIPSSSSAEEFRRKFVRDTLFPSFDEAKLHARLQAGSNKGFLDQLKTIKDRRNYIDHADKLLREGKMKPEPAKVLEQANALSRESIFFFESGSAHDLFPEVILVLNNLRNLRRKWSVRVIDERGSDFPFPISKEQLSLFVPDCEILCWPPGSVPSGPKVALIKLWRE